jgi:hypothetical protein
MAYQILAYVAAANNGLLTDMAAIVDPNFSARGGTNGAQHWIFTELYDLVAICGAGATITQLQLYDSTYNAINIPQVYPINLGITPLANPNVMDLRRQPWPLPLNEEIAFQCSGGAGGAEDDYALIWIRPTNGQGTPPPAPNTLTTPRVFAVFTASVTLTAKAWSPDAAITFTNPLKGGAYQVNGCYFVVAHALAYRINFVKAPLYMGRKLLPGNLVENVYGNVPLKAGDDWLGEMGRFNNFELPKIAVLGTTTEAAATYTGILDMTYLGNAGPDAMP